MALPTVKYPTYSLTIPSTQEKVRFRPFTVAEEKILLMANESAKQEDITSAITRVLEVCFLEKVKVKDLPSFDIEYMFLNLRAKSVSETIDMRYQNQECPKEDNNPCKRVVNISIKIDEIKVQQEKEVDGEISYQVYDPKNITEFGTKILITDDLGVTMKYPSLEKLAEANKEETAIEQLEYLVCSCITSVFDQENVHTDFSRKEMYEWYNALLSSQKEKMIEFVKSMPFLRHEMTYKCSTCGFEEVLKFEGLQSFL